MTLDAFELAWQQWTSSKGARSLIAIWEQSEAKRQQEKLVGALAAKIAPLRTVVEVGCGAGLLVPHLPEFQRYRGYDISKPLTQEAKERLKGDKRCRFFVHDLRNQAPYKRPVDLVICVDVALHYLDPLDILAQVVENWPGHHYLLSTAYGTDDLELLNARILTRKHLLTGLEQLGTTIASDERVYGGSFWMYYALIKPHDSDQ